MNSGNGRFGHIVKTTALETNVTAVKSKMETNCEGTIGDHHQRQHAPRSELDCITIETLNSQRRAPSASAASSSSLQN